MEFKKNRIGFTLIELLIVITIIGILAVAFLPALLGSPSKARDRQRIADLNKLFAVITADYIANGELHASDQAQILCIDGINFGKFTADMGGTIPTDPESDNSTFWCALNGPGKYQYIRYHTTSTDYAFSLSTRVENSENGNIECDATIFSWIPTTADFNAIADEGDCYILLGAR